MAAQATIELLQRDRSLLLTDIFLIWQLTKVLWHDLSSQHLNAVAHPRFHFPEATLLH